jgi:hypothetical protein
MRDEAESKKVVTQGICFTGPCLVSLHKNNDEDIWKHSQIPESIQARELATHGLDL